VINLTTWPLYSKGKGPQYVGVGGCVAPIDSVDVLVKQKNPFKKKVFVLLVNTADI